MKIDVMDIDKFIKVNNLQEVTNPINFHKGSYPTEDGLFSYEIFGRAGSYDRKTTYAYIDLKEKFLHPLVYKNLIRLNRKIESLVNGYEYFILKNGELTVSDEETGGTGLDFLYKIWDKIVFKTTDSNKRDERIDFIKALKRDEAFITKEIVMPAFYRDINMSSSGSGILKHDKINDIYAKLIRLVKALDENANSGIDFISNSTKASIQSYLVEIFDYTIGLTKKKNGLFRQAVMGKSLDYSARNVISEASYTSVNHYKNMKVDMTHTGVPLATAINTFFPFIIRWVQDFFERQLGNIKTISQVGKDGKEKKVYLASDALDDYSYDVIKEKIHLYTKAPSERFETLPVRLSDGSVQYLYYLGKNRNFDETVKDSTISNRKLTWTDVFYQAAVDVCKDKHVYITRYPLEDYFNIYPSKITVLSTTKTASQYIDGVYYEFYPIINPDLDKEDVRGLFIDSLQVFNAYLSGLGGDFDGDMVTIRGVFTQEANEEADRILNSPSNVLNLMGKNNRPISMECVQTIYDMTK